MRTCEEELLVKTFPFFLKIFVPGFLKSSVYFLTRKANKRLMDERGVYVYSSDWADGGSYFKHLDYFVIDYDDQVFPLWSEGEIDKRPNPFLFEHHHKPNADTIGNQLYELQKNGKALKLKYILECKFNYDEIEHLVLFKMDRFDERAYLLKRVDEAAREIKNTIKSMFS